MEIPNKINKNQAILVVQGSQLSEEEKASLIQKINDKPGPASLNVAPVLVQYFSKKKKTKLPKFKQTKKVSIDDIDFA